MSAEIPTFPLSEGNLPASDSVTQALETFQGVQSRALRQVLRLLPWVLLAGVALDTVVFKAGDPMFNSGIVAAALSLFAFQVLMWRIPETLGTIWSRNLIAAQPTKDSTEKVLNSTANPSPLEDQYRTFVDDAEGLLNHPGQWLVGVFFLLLVCTWMFLYRGIGQEVRNVMGEMGRLLYRYGVISESRSFPVVLLTSFVVGLEFFIAFILGLMVWRMIVAGLQVWQLGKKFDLTPQLGHPDRCGGFEPLGDLCLWNALILTVPAVYLGGWATLGPKIGWGYYTTLHSTLLLVPMTLAFLSFFLPMWGVHQVMVAKRAVVRRQLDQLSQSINQLAREMLDRADELETGEGEEMAKKLELMRQIYQQNQHYPVWPFNVGILAKFVTSQAVPLLGLTGLGGTIVDVIKALLSLIQTQA